MPISLPLPTMQSPPLLGLRTRTTAAAALRQLTSGGPPPSFLSTMATSSSAVAAACATSCGRTMACACSRAFSGVVASLATREAASGAPDHPPLVVVSFYKFADVPDHADMRKPLKNLCEDEVGQFDVSCSLLKDCFFRGIQDWFFVLLLWIGFMILYGRKWELMKCLYSRQLTTWIIYVL